LHHDSYKNRTVAVVSIAVRASTNLATKVAAPLMDVCHRKADPEETV